jgi:hypothetical protein
MAYFLENLFAKDQKNDNRAIFAIYQTKSEVKEAIRALRKIGFNENDLAASQPIKDGAQDFPQVQKNQIRNGAFFGAILGAFIVGGIYLYMSTRSTALVGSEYLMMNSIFAAVSSIVLGALAGAACGTLVGIGTPDPAAKRYGQYMHAGGILMSVHCKSPQQMDQAEKALMATGGQDIHLGDERSNWSEALLENMKLSESEIEKSRYLHV